MYSQRLIWSSSTNAFNNLLAAKRRAGVHSLDLTSSNPTEVLSHYPHAAIREAYGAVSDFHYRPAAAGNAEARQAISHSYRQQGLALSPENVFLTASTSEAYSLLFKLFCDLGDEVLAPIPSYPLFEYLAALEGVRIIPYHLVYDGSWHIDFAHLRHRLSPRTKSIIIVSPHNPTGSVLKKFELDELLGIAAAHRLPIISDEVFAGYWLRSLTNAASSLAAQNSVLAFSLNGLSKSAGMPQMKLGWIAVGGPPEETKTAGENLELLLDTYLSVGTPVQNALPRLLEIGVGIRSEIARRIEQNYSLLAERLDHSPATCLQTDAGWSAIIRLPNLLGEDAWVARLLSEANVLVQPGYFFDMPGEAYVVVSLITPVEEFKEGIRRMKALLQ